MTQIISEQIISEAINGFIKAFFDLSKPSFKNLKNQVKYLLDDGLFDYLEQQYSKHAYIKTILHRSVPKYLYDIYQPIKLKLGKETILTNSVKGLFTSTNFVTIIGKAGSGKSTLVKHLFLNTIEEKCNIPILIQLRYLNDYDRGLEDYLREKIISNNLSPSNKILDRLLDNGEFIFFLDGYDEINSLNKHKIIDDLNSFINKYSDNKYILTSRPYSNVELVPFFYNYEICKLSDKEIKEFIQKQKCEEDITQKIIKSINENSTRYIKEFLKNPLLLSLYILTYKAHSKIPSKKYVFYRRVIEVLFSEHDSLTKLGYDRERLAGLSQEEYEEILKRFCFLSYFQDRYNFDKDYIIDKFNIIKGKLRQINFDNEKLIEDLKVNLALWIEDSGILSFAHRSLQEYFAALYIKGLDDYHKKSVYNKIQNDLLYSNSFEIYNFLSLCKEMDKISYYSYLLLPALKYVYRKINKSTLDKKIKSVINFFFKDVTLTQKGNDPSEIATRVLSSNNKNNKYHFTMLLHIDELTKGVFDVWMEENIKEIILKRKYKDFMYVKSPTESFKIAYCISFDKSLDSELIGELKKTFLGRSIEQFIKEVEMRISDVEEEISQENKANEDLISLI